MIFEVSQTVQALIETLGTKQIFGYLSIAAAVALIAIYYLIGHLINVTGSYLARHLSSSARHAFCVHPGNMRVFHPPLAREGRATCKPCRLTRAIRLAAQLTG